MTIDDFKALMDGFDPASLLPELDTLIGKLALVARIAVLIGPVMLLVMGLLYFFASPKEANYHFGYRCYYGMGSVQAWQFTQHLAGIVWGALGLILGIVMLVVKFKKYNLGLKIVGGMLIAVSILGLVSRFGLLSGVDIPILQFGIPGVLSLYFDLFSGFVQAFVFSLLSMVYIAGACPPPEEETGEAQN